MRSISSGSHEPEEMLFNVKSISKVKKVAVHFHQNAKYWKSIW
jgi:hypothetical protein